MGGNIHETYQNFDFSNPQADSSSWRLRRMPNFLPVRVQDFLHGGKPEM
jgi:hypothetical protein